MRISSVAYNECRTVRTAHPVRTRCPARVQPRWSQAAGTPRFVAIQPLRSPAHGLQCAWLQEEGMDTLRRTMALVSITLTSFCNSGCTLVGMGIGGLIDSKTGKPQRAPVWEVSRVGPGAPVTLYLADGKTVTGALVGTQPREEAEYRAAFAAARAARSELAALPELGTVALQ